MKGKLLNSHCILVINGLRNLNYEKRLKKAMCIIRIPRQFHCDMIKLFKIIHDRCEASIEQESN